MLRLKLPGRVLETPRQLPIERTRGGTQPAAKSPINFVESAIRRRKRTKISRTSTYISSLSAQKIQIGIGSISLTVYTRCFHFNFACTKACSGNFILRIAAIYIILFSRKDALEYQEILRKLEEFDTIYRINASFIVSLRKSQWNEIKRKE